MRFLFCFVYNQQEQKVDKFPEKYVVRLFIINVKLVIGLSFVRTSLSWDSVKSGEKKTRRVVKSRPTTASYYSLVSIRSSVVDFGFLLCSCCLFILLVCRFFVTFIAVYYLAVKLDFFWDCAVCFSVHGFFHLCLFSHFALSQYSLEIHIQEKLLRKLTEKSIHCWGVWTPCLCIWLSIYSRKYPSSFA